MKKVYISPEAFEFKIQIAGMLAVSNLSMDSENTITKDEMLGHETDADWDDEEY